MFVQELSAELWCDLLERVHPENRQHLDGGNFIVTIAISPELGRAVFVQGINEFAIVSEHPLPAESETAPEALEEPAGSWAED